MGLFSSHPGETQLSSSGEVADVYSQYGYAVPGASPFNNYTSREYEADIINSIATTLLSRDIEQQQYLRNHDYVAEYARLTAAGMNPLTAMQAMAGGAAPYQPVSASQPHAGHGGQEPLGELLGLAANSAQGAARAYDDLQSGKLKDVQANLMPDQVKSVQDLQRSESRLNALELKFKEAAFDSDLSAKAISNRLNDMHEQLMRVQKENEKIAGDYARKQLSWYDPSKRLEMFKGIQDIHESVARELQAKSQAGLNETTQRRLIPAQVEYMGKQGNLIDKQGNLVDQQTFNAKVDAVAGRIENIHKQTGLPYDVMSGLLLFGAEKPLEDAFDQFGSWKFGHPIDLDTPAGKLLQEYGNIDAASYGDAHKAARAAVIQGYIKSGAQVAGASAVGIGAAAKLGSKAAPAAAAAAGGSLGDQFLP